MTRTPHATSNIHFARCLYRFPNGKRCQLYVSDASSHFCTNHLPATPHRHIRPTVVENSQPTDIDLSAELGIAGPADLKTPDDIYNFLCKLTFLLSANRISPRRAAVLAYLTSQVVRTGCVIHKLTVEENAEIPEITINVPRPQRDPAGPYGNSAGYPQPGAGTPIDSGAKP